MPRKALVYLSVSCAFVSLFFSMRGGWLHLVSLFRPPVNASQASLCAFRPHFFTDSRSSALHQNSKMAFSDGDAGVLCSCMLKVLARRLW